MSIGHQMTLSVGGIEVARAQNVDLAMESKMADTTTRQSAGWEESEPAKKSWSVDVEQLYVSTNSALRAIMAAWMNDTKVAVVLTDAEGNTHTGQAYVKSLKRGEPLDDAVALQGTLQGTGALVSNLAES